MTNRLVVCSVTQKCQAHVMLRIDYASSSQSRSDVALATVPVMCHYLGDLCCTFEALLFLFSVL